MNRERRKWDLENRKSMLDLQNAQRLQKGKHKENPQIDLLAHEALDDAKGPHARLLKSV
jgi:hypothetical protein